MQNTDIDLQSRPVLARAARVQVDPVGGGPVLLYPEGLLKLNETAHAILSRCDGKRTVAEVIVSLAAEYNADAEMLGADVLECLGEFRGRHLVIFTA